MLVCGWGGGGVLQAIGKDTKICSNLTPFWLDLLIQKKKHIEQLIQNRHPKQLQKKNIFSPAKNKKKK